MKKFAERLVDKWTASPSALNAVKRWRSSGSWAVGNPRWAVC
ncbi:hypothetical protein ACVXG7_11405 [Enterobacter hormaechei]